MTLAVLITEQLRRPVPGGIGTYIRGLVDGIAVVGGADAVTTWQSRLPVAVRSRLWDRGIGRVPGDLVHAPSLATPARTKRLVVTVHDLAWREVPETFPARGRAWHERALARALARAEHFVVPSTRTADGLVGAGADAARVTVIEEGCDHLPPPDEAGAAAVVAGDFVLAVGTIEPRKNLVRVAEAYRRARPRLPGPWPLIVVGPPGWGARHDLSDVVATGPIDDAVLSGLYRRARAFVYAPLLEGFGLPPVEAMHAGVPVVASNAVPSVGDGALIVDPLDVDAIADAVVTAATDESVRRDLIARGNARAAQLTWKAAAQQHLDLWSSLS